MRHVMTAILLALVPVAPAAAQSDADQVVADIQQAYSHFEYEEADSMGREALRHYNRFTVEQLTNIHTVLGLVSYSRGDLRESERQFTSALQLTPDLELDPLFVSPKIVAFFTEVQEDVSDGGGPAGAGTVHYVVRPDRRADAAARSMVLPGWGQFYKGHRRKGWLISGLFGAAAVGAVGAHVKRLQAQDAYRSETDRELVEDRYHTYNRWHKVRGGLLQGAAVVWAVGYVDALLTQPSIGNDRARVVLRSSPQSLSLTLHF